MGKMHGVGLYTYPSGAEGEEGRTEEALMRDNVLLCLKKGACVCMCVMSALHSWGGCVNGIDVLLAS